ncbi:hypothetical protein, partial [Paracoccus nototheniae]|uniref:hypothetical protein n=1 Tax=Paracoccus nototheniae TaxID=2489002 RepID=UPI0039EA89DC
LGAGIAGLARALAGLGKVRGFGMAVADIALRHHLGNAFQFKMKGTVLLVMLIRGKRTDDQVDFFFGKKLW